MNSATAPTVPPPAEAGQFRMIPLAHLVESSTNPRKRFDEKSLQELADDVSEHGVLVPLLVRPPAGSGEPSAVRPFEVLAGARRFRAATAAGLHEIPVRVMDVDDVRALEIQLLENLHRADVHPMEEAAGYQMLMEKAKWGSADELAARIGKSKSYVYQRLKLLELTDEAQKAFLEEEITSGHAVMLARLDPKYQREALKACTSTYWDGDENAKRIVSVRELGRWVATNLHLDLANAPWDTKDAKLVPKAGSCVACPKRTGAAAELFPDIKKKDTCTDRSCFGDKQKAFIALREEQLGKKGEEVIKISDRRVYDNHGRKELKDQDILSANDFTEIGKGVESCESTTVALVAEGPNIGKTKKVCADPKCKVHHGSSAFGRAVNGHSAAQKAADKKTKAERLFRAALLDEVMAEVDGFDALPLPLARLIVCELFGELQQETQKILFKRHAWEIKKEGYSFESLPKALARNIEKHSPAAVSTILVEIALLGQTQVFHYGSSKPETLLEMAKALKVDVELVRKSTIEPKPSKALKTTKPAKLPVPKAAKPKAAKVTPAKRVSVPKKPAPKPVTKAKATKAPVNVDLDAIA